MNILFLIYQLSTDNTHLMPWRYVLEMAKGLAAMGSRVTIVSNKNADYPELFTDRLSIKIVEGSFKSGNIQYQAIIDELKPDAVFAPIARRFVLFQSIDFIGDIPYFAYFPSPWYDPQLIRKVLKRLPFRDAFIYCIESIIPGKWLVKKLRREKVRGIVTMTEYTAKHLVKNAWPEPMVKAILPGVDCLLNYSTSSVVYDKYAPIIAGRKHLLYMGPARTVRGIYFAMKAFDTVADDLNDVALICLIRESTDKEITTFRQVVKKLRNRNSFVVIEDRLNQNDVVHFIQSSHVVMLPFLLIPSEIPLAVIEAMSLGKPVIITETGGTSAFVGKGGIVVPQNDVRALADGIKHVFLNDKAYKNMCSEATAIILKQQPWLGCARQLYDFTSTILMERATMD